MSSNIEKQSLEAHVDLCAERYKGLQEDLSSMSQRIEKLEADMTKKLDRLEGIVSEIKESLTKKETAALRNLVTIGIGIIASLLGTVGGLVWWVITHR